MADAYWIYGESNQEQGVSSHPPRMVKRPRAEFEMPSGHHTSSYYACENAMAGHRVIRDTDRASLLASYERYLRSVPIGGEAGRSISGLDDLPEIYDFRDLGLLRSSLAAAATSHFTGAGGADPVVAGQRRFLRVGGQPEIPLSHDASSTLFVEGLPSNCTRREVSHLFRPFLGYKDLRLVCKESRHSRGDLVVLCFVDFQSPAHAATAMDVLQGYTFDEHDRASGHLRIQFARSPGARSGGRRV